MVLALIFLSELKWMQNDMNEPYCHHLISQSNSSHKSGKNLKSICRFSFFFLSFSLLSFSVCIQTLSGKTRGLRILLKVAVRGFLKESHNILLASCETLSRFFAEFQLSDFWNSFRHFPHSRMFALPVHIHALLEPSLFSVSLLVWYLVFWAK